MTSGYQTGASVQATSFNNTSVYGRSDNFVGVYGQSGPDDADQIPGNLVAGVTGASQTSAGVQGWSTTANGVEGWAYNGTGLFGVSNYSRGFSEASPMGSAVYGFR